MKLADVKTFDQLLPWLASHLDWPVDEIEIAPDTAFDDLTYEYEGKELGLKQEDIAHVREIRQLRPLVTNQPWGIFFVNFEDKKIPVGVLKRILGGLTIRKRKSANKAEQKAWTLHDLLFISSFGKSGERELSFLHFAEENGGKNKTVLKELGWDHQDTKLKLDFVERTLKSNLVWPEDPSDADAWRTQWSSAFTSTHGATIRTAKELTRRLADLASAIRKAGDEVLEYENRNGPLTKIYENFRHTIFHNLTPPDFADMYAQTICYGLLAKQIERARNGLDTTNLTADDAALTQGVMQPFLKDLMEAFLAVGGRKSSIDFNELGVNEVVELLQAADMHAVLLDFGNRNPNEDPVLHFYEHFLRDYDSIMREQRGVYYTPLPVVRFIVRSVHELLQKEFGLPDGLADTATWGEMVRQNPGLSVPKAVSADAPFVQILDPATGTGTFLVEAIELIETHLKNKWRREGKKDLEVLALWNEYVPRHLLPRLNGFELMMAPYAIAHIKLGIKLHETGYRPKSDSAPRIRVYLTNTLEKPTGYDSQGSMSFIVDSLALEAKGADDIKGKTPITVVLGNPPYSRNSYNLAPEHRAHVDHYRSINGTSIVQRGHLELERAIQNDYVKFIAYSLTCLSRCDIGIIGLITSNSFRSAQLLGGLRFHWLKEISKLSIVDLHGYAQGAANASSEDSDENVFNILEGVAIHFSRRLVSYTQAPRVDVQDVRGRRDEKYKLLLRLTHSKGTPIDLTPPRYYFTKVESSGTYHEWPPIDEVFKFLRGAIVTARDGLVLNFEREPLLEKIAKYRDANDLKSASLQLGARWSGSWANEGKAAKAQNAIKKLQREELDSYITKISYRPLDFRYLFYCDDFLDTPARAVMNASVRYDVIGLGIGKSTRNPLPDHFIVSRYPVEAKFAESTKQCHFIPLYVESQELARRSLETNISSSFANAIGQSVGRTYDEKLGIGFTGILNRNDGDDASNNISNVVEISDTDTRSDSFGSHDIFCYIYSILYSSNYRSRFADFLKSDFPRVPVPRGAALFNDLIAAGRQLVALHLLDEKDAQAMINPVIRFVGKSEARVDRGFPKYENGRVIINRSCWFEDVTPEVWNFHIGGYQVCEKWLKDRAGQGGKNPSPGRVLSADDILHYRRITVALRETIRLMAEIDQVIERHGGWPDAFAAAPADKAEAAQ